MTSAPIEALWKENPPEAWDLTAIIANYEKPLLLALAARGESINNDTVLEDVEREHAPSATLVGFPGAGHNLHRTGFDAFATALDNWLGQTQV
jgi:pimeloyl-ACP methyl ester carboxylesterase